MRTIRLGSYAPPDQQYSSFQATQSASESVLPSTSNSSTNIGFTGASNVSYQNRDEHSIPKYSGIADVDQLDVPNLWGHRFHHDSPYDLGQKKGKKPLRPIGGSATTSVTDVGNAFQYTCVRNLHSIYSSITEPLQTLVFPVLPRLLLFHNPHPLSICKRKARPPSHLLAGS